MLIPVVDLLRPLDELIESVRVGEEFDAGASDVGEEVRRERVRRWRTRIVFTIVALERRPERVAPKWMDGLGQAGQADLDQDLHLPWADRHAVQPDRPVERVNPAAFVALAVKAKRLHHLAVQVVRHSWHGPQLACRMWTGMHRCEASKEARYRRARAD